MGKGGEKKCLEVAARQHGVIGRRQALEAGVTVGQLKGHVKAGRWLRVRPAVYRLAGASESWHQHLAATSLWAEADYAFSHRTAAALHGFARYEAGPVHVTLTRTAMLPPPDRVFRVETLPRAHVCCVEGFRVTTIERTLLDLAATEPACDVRASIDQALRRRKTAIPRLEQVAAVGDWAHGAPTLRELLAELHHEGGPTESELEAMVRDILKDAGLTPTRQQRVKLKGRVRRLDFVFEREKIVIEADGYETHSSWQDFQEDRRRNNALIAQGYRVLHWTWAQVRDCPEQLVAELRAVLALVRGGAH